MKDNQNDDLGTINFLDIDSSGKVLKIEEDIEDTRIPEIEKEVTPERELTRDEKEMVAGTFIANEEERRKKEEERIEKQKNNQIKIVLLGVMILSVIIYGFIGYFSIQKTVKQRDIEAKIVFLTDNANYANDIKGYFKDLTTNANNYYKNYINQLSMKNKAKNYNDSIEKEINKLVEKKETFTKYKADDLYAIIYGRLNEAKNLATIQAAGGDATDLAYKTNEFVITENSNSEKYEAALKKYLTDNEIPFTESNGQLIYDSETQK